MRRTRSAVAVLAAAWALGAVALDCGGRTPLDEDAGVGTVPQAFDSHEAVLLDFEFDGKIVTDSADPALIRPLVQAQLLYTVGALNADRSAGRLERATLSQIASTPRDGSTSYDVTYHAKLPVAWSPSDRPTRYTFTLPARVGEEDQKRFTAKYGKSCVDPEGGELGPADVGRMFYEYRPKRGGCRFDPADVVTFVADVSTSSESTSGKYPEYQRVWEDSALDVIVLFSRSAFEVGTDDEGIRAFQDFLAQSEAYLRARQPDASKVSVATPSPSTGERVATLPDGRTVRIDAALVGTRLAEDGPDFDAWYDARTPAADLVIYSGHAGLGANVRTLMTKGAFATQKYLVWVLNGCDTFAYVDRTLADRRAALNPDDPSGTKYMDTVATAMGGFFSTGAATTMTFLDAFVSARDVGAAPKTYRALFAGVDPRQVTVVTGEEDNVFDPSMFAKPGAPPPTGADASTPAVETDPTSPATSPSSSAPPPPPPPPPPAPSSAPSAPASTTPVADLAPATSDGSRSGSCSAAPGGSAPGGEWLVALAFALSRCGRASASRASSRRPRARARSSR